MSAIGWLEDRLTATPSGAGATTGDSWSIHLRIVALVAFVMAVAEAVSLMGGVTLVASVMLVVPLVSLGWVLLQARFQSSGRRRIGQFLLRAPTFRGEATVLACSGFMGVAIAGVLPVGGLTPLLTQLPPIAVPLLVPVLLIVTGQLGLNPVAVVALLGAAMPDPALLGVPPAALAFACMIGWGLGVGITPMSASAITTARWAGVSPWTVSTAWNVVFTLYALVLTWVAIGLVFLWGP
jgi:hypothetical protein